MIPRIRMARKRISVARERVDAKERAIWRILADRAKSGTQVEWAIQRSNDSILDHEALSRQGAQR
jgi:hypothetical protein